MPTKTQVKRPALRWFGGKWRLAPWIIENLPAHRVYVEPYGGAASVLLRKPRSYAEVLNDLDDELYNFFCVIKGSVSHEILERQLRITPYARREFELAHSYNPDPIERARRLVIRSFMGFGADSASNLASKTGFRSNSNRSGTTPARDFVNYADNVKALYERLSGVVLENKSAIEVIKQHDSADTTFYVDPPYPHSTRRGGRYFYEMTEGDHLELLDALKSVKGNVVLSGLDHPEYNKLTWHRIEKDHYADGAKKIREVLWIKTN